MTRGVRHEREGGACPDHPLAAQPVTRRASVRNGPSLFSIEVDVIAQTRSVKLIVHVLQLSAAFGKSPLKRARLRGLQRNAAVEQQDAVSGNDAE